MYSSQIIVVALVITTVFHVSQSPNSSRCEPLDIHGINPRTVRLLDAETARMEPVMSELLGFV